MQAMSLRYQLILSRDSLKFLKKQETTIQTRIGKALQGLTFRPPIGDIKPLVPCGQCEHCKATDYGLCDNYNIIGTGSNGAFAEYVKVPKEHVLKIDESLEFETAAGIEPATIGYHGLQKANIQPGETVVVMGCG